MNYTTLTDRESYRYRKSLARYLPYLDILDDFIIKKNGNFVAGFEIEALDNMGISASDYEVISTTLESALNRINERINLQFIYSFDYYPYQESYTHADDPVLNYFKFNRHQYFSFYKYLRCRMHVFVDFDAGTVLKNPFNITFSTNPIVKRLRIEHQRMVTQKENELKPIHTNLENTGIRLRRLRNSELIDFLYKSLNFVTDEFNGEISGLALNNELVTQDYVKEKGYLKIGNTFVACLSLSLLPEATQSFSMINGIPLPYIFSLLHSLPFPHRVVFSSQNINMEKQVAQLSRKLNYTRFLMNFSRNREGRRSEVRYHELNDLLDEIYQYHKKLATISLNTVIYDTDIQKLNQKINRAMLAFNSMNKSQAVLETLDILPMFISCLPGNSAENYHRLLVKTANASHFIAVSNFSRGYHRGIVVKNRNNEPILFDYFDPHLNNWNAIIIGPTGTGKSYLMQAMLLQLLEQGIKVFGLDVGGVGNIGGSYKKMISLLNGRYIELDMDNPIPLNPFALIGNNYDTRKKLFLRAFIEKLILEREEKSISKVEQAFISTVLDKYVSEYRGPRNLKTFVAFFAQQQDSEGFVDVKLLARKMYIYTHGEYSQFLCADNMIEIKEDLVCFDLKGLETHPDLQGIIAIIITGLLWELMERNLSAQKVIFADELWKVLSDNTTIGHLVVELFRTSRKMGAGIFAISQSIEDIESASFSKPIKDNALNHFIMAHKPKQLDSLTRAFGYGEHELSLISSLRRGEFFLDRDGHTTVLKIDTSTYDHYLFTTNRQENNDLEDKMAKYNGNLLKAIERLAKMREEKNVVHVVEK
ncbi:ATP-binding protein [candidate division KSB1 bacterium]|nr:ATP-binding protein [candidate division KSB1 bacterium]